MTNNNNSNNSFIHGRQHSTTNDPALIMHATSSKTTRPPPPRPQTPHPLPQGDKVTSPSPPPSSSAEKPFSPAATSSNSPVNAASKSNDGKSTDADGKSRDCNRTVTFESFVRQGQFGQMDGEGGRGGKEDDGQGMKGRSGYRAVKVGGKFLARLKRRMSKAEGKGKGREG